MSRRLLVFVIIDVIVIAALLGWWLYRRTPVATPAPTAQSAPSPASVPPAAAVPAEAPEAAAPAPEAPAGPVELHGTFHGQPFWARLAAPSPEFGGKRRLELVYTPPAPAAVSGSLIHDSPLLLLDERLALVAWNNRDGATGLTTTAAPTGYKLVREVHGAGDSIELFTRSLVGAPAWDLRLAPLLLALCWRADAGERSMRVVDFWGPRASEKLRLGVRGVDITVGGDTWTVSPDGAGHLARLVAADGSDVLTVASRR